MINQIKRKGLNVCVKIIFIVPVSVFVVCGYVHDIFFSVQIVQQIAQPSYLFLLLRYKLKMLGN